MPTCSSLADLDLDKKRFNHKAHIKPWLLTTLRPRGINVVIERSDTNKIIFKCRLGITPTHRYPCPFRIRANYSIKLRVWLLVVINDTHNHDLFPLMPSPPPPLRPQQIPQQQPQYPVLPLLAAIPQSSLLSQPSLQANATPAQSTAATITSTLLASTPMVPQPPQTHVQQPQTSTSSAPPSSSAAPPVLPAPLASMAPQLPKLGKIIPTSTRISEAVLAVNDVIETKVDGLSHQDKCTVLELVLNQVVGHYRKYFNLGVSLKLQQELKERPKMPPLLALLVDDRPPPLLAAATSHPHGDEDGTNPLWLALIPLLPLLNDTDPDYQLTLTLSIENLIHMPGLSLTTQPMALPSFNSIQNKFTLLPTLSSALPPLGATMNPLHMLKPSQLDLKGTTPAKDRFDFPHF